MVTETKFGCNFTELWVSPSDWNTSKEKKKSDDWYVQCVFFDPAFKENPLMASNLGSEQINPKL